MIIVKLPLYNTNFNNCNSIKDNFMIEFFYGILRIQRVTWAEYIQKIISSISTIIKENFFSTLIHRKNLF